ncbi:MAG: nucleotide exchange factor GrpE [Burkholderiales bacterium]|nr:nucleotide exchange factor GrpE [Burkholderiales bacterium]
MSEEVKPGPVPDAPSPERPASDAPAAAALPYQAMEAKVVELEAELARAKEDFLRAKAETENTRRRAQADIANAHKYASESFAESLVPVKDSLEAALADSSAALDTLKSGVELTLKQLVAAFERARITQIDPAGAKFDPRFHQAISMVEADSEPNHVITVLQKGYQLHERVLRPALVTVAKPRQAPSA